MEACCLATANAINSLNRARGMIGKQFGGKENPASVEEEFSNEKNGQNRPVSPLNKPKGYSGLLKLVSDISQRFVPNNKLEELVTKKSVLSALQETTIEQQYHDDLASWVLKSSPRLFLTLILLTGRSSEQLSWLKNLKDDGVSDSVLPLSFSNAEPPYGFSLAAEPEEGGRKFDSFKAWEDNALILFKAYRWIFLAPVFGASNQFRHQLDSEQPLPFSSLSENASKDWEIHAAHIDSQCLLALGMNTPDLQGIPVFIKQIQPSDKIYPFFDIETGKFKAPHPIISSRRIHPIASYQRSGDDYVIFRWVDGDSPSN
ncbi:hypothetical protein F4825DRAFT_475646 [Nemania diffusa]|nr:hypothetical protein F4825DRAFT_475646 [Nemania diffusa]